MESCQKTGETPAFTAFTCTGNCKRLFLIFAEADRVDKKHFLQKNFYSVPRAATGEPQGFVAVGSWEAFHVGVL